MFCVSRAGFVGYAAAAFGEFREYLSIPLERRCKCGSSFGIAHHVCLVQTAAPELKPAIERDRDLAVVSEAPIGCVVLVRFEPGVSDHARIGGKALVLVVASQIALKIDPIDLEECKTTFWALHHHEAWVEVEIFPVDVAEAQRLPAAVNEGRLREVQADRLPFNALPRNRSSAHPVLNRCTPGHIPDLG